LGDIYDEIPLSLSLYFIDYDFHPFCKTVQRRRGELEVEIVQNSSKYAIIFIITFRCFRISEYFWIRV